MDPGEPTTTRATRARTRRRNRTEPDAAAAPSVLDRYRLTRRLGTGAFGTVWMARDERLDRDVAVKILARERIVGGRFEREARAAARLSHPAIVTLYEAAVDDEGAYLVSELVRGTTLDVLLSEGRLSDRDIVSVGITLCDALEHAHGQGVVHRDVKPSNVLVPDAPATAEQVAKLTDFGVARVVGGDSLTITGDVIGTLAYMAPEQAEGLEAGPAADLYSLALVVYEALTGVNPLAQGATQRSRRLGAHLPPLRRQRRDLPRALGLGIDLALRPRPRERGTVAEFREALRAVKDEVGDEPGVIAAPVSPWTTLLGHANAPEDPAEEEDSRAV
ncbi:MAG TPA: serine/threonine-protein kinase, partial [Solirubrobacteraceae bacterium]|nr:serine/threonine-protein kinase [Solirubrobacteraceae bacterium]